MTQKSSKSIYYEALSLMVKRYEPLDTNDSKSRKSLLRFLESSTHPFGKANPLGHVTASTWIINHDATKVLMTYHRKLEKWLQLGGHTNEDESIQEAALREAREESGNEAIELLYDAIYDLDVHFIPAHGATPAHYHYDVRFLCLANDDGPIAISDESIDLKWISVSKINEYTVEPSILRMIEHMTRMPHLTKDIVCILGGPQL